MPLSYSQLQTYRRCPKQYEYAFVEKIQRQLSAGESFGVSMHSTLKRWGEMELQHQPKNDERLTLFQDEDDTPLPELSEVALLQLWRECFVGAGYDSRAEEDAALNRGEAALKHFFRWWSEKKRNVLAVEKGFSLEIPELNDVLKGRFDRVEEVDGEIAVIDYKTGKEMQDNQLHADLQLSVYAMAAEKIWKKPVTSLILLSIKEEGCKEQVTTRNQSQLQDASKAIAILEESMLKKDFTPDPTTEKCRCCPYKDICPASLAR